MVLEPAVYIALIVLGGGLTHLDLKEGYCMNQTWVTRAGSPIWYWSEIAVSLFLVLLGVRALGELWA